MAEFYLDVSALGNEYSVYNDVPTWGTPQDGNGKAGPGHSAAVAIATIDVAGCTATGGSVGVMGVTLSGLNSSGATLATDIAAAINASATATGSTYSALLLPLNKLVYARVNPGLSTQVQIMCRIAGVDWNGMAPTQAGIAPAATIGAFAGGADGPFAYWWHTATVFGKTHPATTPGYGLLVRAPGSVTNPGVNDPIHVRTKRSGVNLDAGQFATTDGSQMNFTTASRTFVFDNGTIWAGDDGVFLASTLCDNRFAWPPAWMYVGNGSRWIARKKWGLKWTHNGNAGEGKLLFIDQGGHIHTWETENIWIEAGSTTGDIFMAATYYQNKRLHKGSRFDFRVARTIAGNNSYGYGWTTRYYDCDINYIAAGPTPSGIVDLAGNAYDNADALLELIDTRFSFVSGGPITQLFSGTAFNSAFRCVVENCVGLRPEVMPGSGSDINVNRNLVFSGCRDSVSGSSGRSFVADSGLAFTSFIDNDTYPYLDAQTPTGSYWSVRTVLKAGRIDQTMTPIMRLSTLYRGVDAAKVISCEILVPSGVTFNKSRLEMMLTFVDSTGVVQHVTTAESMIKAILGAATAVDASAASWSRASGYDAKKLSFDTASISKLVKSGTEIQARVVYRGDTPGGVDRVIYVHPELVLT